MPDTTPQSPFYTDRPVFVQSPVVERRSRLEGNRTLLVLSLIIVVAAGVAGVVYARTPHVTGRTTIIPPAIPEIRP